MKLFLKLLLFLGCLAFISQSSLAQSRVAFRIDMRQQMKDSVFVPSQHQIVIEGNELPFTQLNSFEMEELRQSDSVFVKEIRFPRRSQDKVLEYRYVIKRPQIDDIEESRFRLLNLSSDINRPKILNIAYFNNFPR